MSSYPNIRMLIDGQWIERPGEPVLNPADGLVIGSVPHALDQDLIDAVAAAKKGAKVWRNTSPAKRSEVLLGAVDLVRQRIDGIAMAITLEQGKTLVQARAEVLRGCDLITWDAGEARRIYGRVIPAEPGMRHTVIREPIGVVAAFTPWNYPMSSPARKIGGALAAGCSIVLKAAEETPAGAMLLAQAFMDAGLPAGVLNLVFGHPSRISSMLIAHPDVSMVTFTGSTEVGKQLAALAGLHMKPSIMELGGHAPVIVCEDADPEQTAAACLDGKINNGGQVCVAPTRFFVDASLYERFVTAMGQRAREIQVGPGVLPASQMGPVTNARRLAALQDMTADALGRGARLVSGGQRLDGSGYFWPMTVIADVPEDALAMKTEPFGPLCLLTPTQGLDDAIARANSLPFGLAGYAFTQSASHAYRLSHELQVGNLAINHLVSAVSETPFGGVKDSGHGREGGVEGLECYTHVKSISHKVFV